mgnify:FL=1
MKRTPTNWLKYKSVCRRIAIRADFKCEAIKEDGTRCAKQIVEEYVKPENFAHLGSRNKMTDDEVVSPDRIIFSCSTCHRKDPVGNHTKGVEYPKEEPYYVPEYD